MTFLIIITCVFAALNWVSRWFLNRPLEWVTKPAVTTGLIAMALLLDPAHSTERIWFVVGLIFCLIGDVALMLPKERFIAGLVAFLIGHLSFIVGFATRGEAAPATAVVVALAVAVAAVVITFVRTVRTLGTSSPLFGPVALYMVIILAMGITSPAGGSAAAPLGAAMFAASDAVLADNKFVNARRWKPLTVMMSYHAALALLVISLT